MRDLKRAFNKVFRSVFNSAVFVWRFAFICLFLVWVMSIVRSVFFMFINEMKDMGIIPGTLTFDYYEVGAVLLNIMGIALLLWLYRLFTKREK